MKLNARQLRQLKQPEKTPIVKRFPIYFILENIYDTYNVGGLFRLADALVIEKIYLCGETETPPNHKIKKASVGTDKVVDWKYKKGAKEAIEDLRKQLQRSQKTEDRNQKSENGRQNSNNQFSDLSDFRSPSSDVSDLSDIQVVAVEQHPKALPYFKAPYQLPLALIFGNETFGILPETLKLANQIVEIPMFGVNKSLNVIVSAAVVGYHIILATAAKAKKTKPKKA